jgi:hypothetical protein
MLNKVLPQCIDNTYRGHKLALWIFAFVVFVKTLQAVLVLFDGYSTAVSADGLPLDSYTPAASQTIVTLFALSGYSRLNMSALYVLAWVRYRRAIPLMFILLTLDYPARQVIFHFLPIVRTGTPIGVVVNLVLFALTIIGLVLSLWTRETPSSRRDGSRR